MNEQSINAVKPGNLRPKVNNSKFRKNQIKAYRQQRDSVFYEIKLYDRHLLKNNKTAEEAIKQNLCKLGNHGNMSLTGFNFKKCSATKFVHGSGMYRYTFAGDYKQELVKERNIQKKCLQKLRNQMCLKWQ